MLKKIYIITLFFFGLGMGGYGQNAVTIKVVDEENSPIEFVTILNQSTAEVFETNKKGKADIIYGSLRDEITFSILGYEKQSNSIEDLIQSPVITLGSSYKLLHEITVVGRSDWSVRDMPYEVDVLTKDQIAQLRSTSTADILSNSSKVFVQKSQFGGGSPILRGFEANKILLVLDGVRMNNAIYRSGHLHNAISVDQNGLSSLEIHQGPNALLYGSDAMGGVIHFRTRQPEFSSTQNFTLKELSSNATFTSASRAKIGNLNFSINNNVWSYWGSVTATQLGDLRSGANRPDDFPDFGKLFDFVDRSNGSDLVKRNDDVNVQVGSGYDQIDVIQKVAFRPSPLSQLTLNYQFSSGAVPRFDQLSERNEDGAPNWAEWRYDPQKRHFASLTYDGLKSNAFFDRSKVIAAYQKIFESRVSRRFDSDNRISNDEVADVLSISADFIKGVGMFKFYYGLESQYNDVQSEAVRKNILSDQTFNDVFTRYPSGGSQMHNSGLYSRGVLNPLSWLTLDVGLRYGYSQTAFKYLSSDHFAWPSSFINGIETSTSSLTWSAAVIGKIRDHSRLRFSLSTAFRNPNIDDLAKIRIVRNQVSVPNTGLESEKSTNAEIGYSTDFQLGDYSIGLKSAIFYSMLQDVIVRVPFSLPDGSTSIISDNVEYDVFANVNADDGWIAGGSASIEARYNNWTLEASISEQQGVSNEDELDEAPLAHIPPLFGKTSLGYGNSVWGASAYMIFNGKKPLSEYAPNSSDNEENATSQGTLAWKTYNLRGYWQLNHQWRISLKLENLLDLHYRTFSSGISAPGFNILASINYQWNRK